MITHKQPKMIIGWREWVSLPDFCVPGIKAKIDTGAASSAIHAFDIEPFDNNGIPFVRFSIHPLQGRHDIVIPCEAKLVDRRKVTNSGGKSQNRYVVETTLSIAGRQWPIELTLTNRDQMKFRMLLGRSAMSGRILADPQLSYQAGKYSSSTFYQTLMKK
ncbi:ATP-dependent zinc protease [Maridesulfovibrio sp.]|uniref:ATP-dependent zinc protease family protein n=1 Tax=Maridesulfovibrio sp. TaxID=2795000 RepID=UPI0029F57F49|nr:ATP-dependent zinc protease [Maridesulfovibrio sp.]